MCADAIECSFGEALGEVRCGELANDVGVGLVGRDVGGEGLFELSYSESFFRYGGAGKQRQDDDDKEPTFRFRHFKLTG